MTLALVTRRDYLDDRRRSIIARSLAGAMASALPLPFLDDYAVGAVLGGGYKRIAAAHGIDISHDALMTLVHGASKPPSIVDIATGGMLLRLAGTATKRMLFVLATANRARAASRTYVMMTMFDHYCAKLHVGTAIDTAHAFALRDEMTRAIEQTPGALSFQPFRRGAAAAIRGTLKAPLELADLASRGALRRLLARKSEVTEAEAVGELDQSIEKVVASKSSFLSRAAAAVEIQLAAEKNPFLDSALDAFDLRWRARMAAKVDK